MPIIKPGTDTKEVIARFSAENQTLALMDHPNIAKVFDAGETDAGRPYFAMELVKGVAITDYCDSNSLPTVERIIECCAFHPVRDAAKRHGMVRSSRQNSDA